VQQRGFFMRLFTMTIAGFVFLGMTGLVLANPSMLPKHPGYPSGGEFANDTGQRNLTHSQSLLEAAKSGDTDMFPTLMDIAAIGPRPRIRWFPFWVCMCCSGETRLNALRNH